MNDITWENAVSALVESGIEPDIAESVMPLMLSLSEPPTPGHCIDTSKPIKLVYTCADSVEREIVVTNINIMTPEQAHKEIEKIMNLAKSAKERRDNVDNT